MTAVFILAYVAWVDLLWAGSVVIMATSPTALRFHSWTCISCNTLRRWIDHVRPSSSSHLCLNELVGLKRARTFRDPQALSRLKSPAIDSQTVKSDAADRLGLISSKLQFRFTWQDMYIFGMMMILGTTVYLGTTGAGALSLLKTQDDPRKLSCKSKFGI